MSIIFHKNKSCVFSLLLIIIIQFRPPTHIVAIESRHVDAELNIYEIFLMEFGQWSRNLQCLGTTHVGSIHICSEMSRVLSCGPCPGWGLSVILLHCRVRESISGHLTSPQVLCSAFSNGCEHSSQDGPKQGLKFGPPNKSDNPKKLYRDKLIHVNEKSK